MGQKGMDAVAMQMNIRNNTMEMQDCIKDLYKWEADMHKKEEQLKKAKESQGLTAAPAIRGQAPPVRTTCNPEVKQPAAAAAAAATNGTNSRSCSWLHLRKC